MSSAKRRRRRSSSSRRPQQPLYLLLALLLLLLATAAQGFLLRPPHYPHHARHPHARQPHGRHSLLAMSSSQGGGGGGNNNDDDDPFAIRLLQPNQLRLVRVIGEQRLTIEEETEARDGAGPRGAFGRIRNKKNAAGQQSTSKETRNLGVGARLFEAVDANTVRLLSLPPTHPPIQWCLDLPSTHPPRGNG